MTLVGSVAMLMYGMKVMSEGLQKMAGSKLSNVLGTMTTNRFTGVLTGAFITAAVQSSTATTVMTVSFVSAGILSLAQAISVIMGANIGTTFTAWIMVLGGGSFDMRFVVYAAIILAVGLIHYKRNTNLGEFLLGLALMLLGLTTLKINATDMHLDQIEPVRNFFIATSSWGYGSYFLYLLVGGILTFAVQSSAAIMAITMTLCSTHVLPIDMGISLVLGENIGTTITSNIVALSASVQARRAAMAHLVFNLFGVIWVLCVFRWFVGAVCSVWEVDFTPGVPSDVSPDKLNAVLATFHTSFNIINTMILIGFVPLLEKLVTLIIPSKPEERLTDTQLHFISGGLMSTSELSILQAWKEIHVFGVRTQRMVGMIHDLFREPDEELFSKTAARVEKYEGICDRMEYEIAQYLNQVADGRLSDQSKHEVHKMMRIVSELESVGDANYNLSRHLIHRREAKIQYTPYQEKNIEMMLYLVSNAETMMVQALEQLNITTDEFMEMTNIETEINNFRDELKTQNLQHITDKEYDYSTGVNYMDIILELEKMADYIINVDEALYEHKHDK
ncbi:MAG: Na/Pi cotransporter family protein [Paludibacteraceae bacterium]|nr:Na/Pi cotransporter family protein [Paludibacteraceae bacterium]MBQ6764856.1 Na/Pi cotransporter family protein [Paludibacteraceae bacterium]MBR0065037.1 Na/Pi cotransporter family protein [Paludibacteraceae bacterium]